MQPTSTQRLAAIEANINAALKPLLAEDPILCLGVMQDVARQLNDYVAELSVDAPSQAARALAREHLLRFVGHGVQLLEQLDQIDSERAH